MNKITFVAAHAGFPADRHPLGGGAAVARELARLWSKDSRVDLTLIGPGPGWKDIPCRYIQLASLGSLSPEQLSVSDYAKFSRNFSEAVTAFLEKEPPCWVISNDISEAIDFQKVSQAGHRIATILHVDVVEYVSKIYLKEVFRPETLTRLFERLERWRVAGLLPRVLKLIFQKQRDAVRYSQVLIVPSRKMAEVLRACYGAQNVQVIPWGAFSKDTPPPKVSDGKEYVLMTLSRLSPEKGIDILLKALILWEKEGHIPPLRLLICGGAAYMQGRFYEKKLKHLEQRLKKVRVEFLGHLSEQEKQAVFQRADLFVCPSRHESYGLTIVEAMHSGLPVLTTPHHSASDLVQPEYGHITNNYSPKALLSGLKSILFKPSELRNMGQKAQTVSASWIFDQAASRLKHLLFPTPRTLTSKL